MKLINKVIQYNRLSGLFYELFTWLSQRIANTTVINSKYVVKSEIEIYLDLFSGSIENQFIAPK